MQKTIFMQEFVLPHPNEVDLSVNVNKDLGLPHIELLIVLELLLQQSVNSGENNKGQGPPTSSKENVPQVQQHVDILEETRNNNLDLSPSPLKVLEMDVERSLCLTLTEEDVLH